MIKNTWLWCLAGFLCFSVGGCLRMYIVIRVNGWSGYLARQNGLSESYKRLVADHQAQWWPLPASYFCMALGIAVVFGAIFASK